jgi:hypothetical protein
MLDAVAVQRSVLGNVAFVDKDRPHDRPDNKDDGETDEGLVSFPLSLTVGPDVHANDYHGHQCGSDVVAVQIHVGAEPVRLLSWYYSQGKRHSVTS